MNIFWDAEKYKKDFSFVPQYGEAVMDLLDAAPGSRVVDLGCGNGALTEQLAACGYDVTGVDASAEMLELAREGHPELKFLPGNALDFTLDEPVDAVFSNAGLHYLRTFYFPTVGEYAPLLEKAGFRVEFATLFDRPTKQNGPDGLADWIRMFDTAPFSGVDPALAAQIIDETVEDLRPVLLHDGVWYVDYVRIRFKVRKL